MKFRGCIDLHHGKVKQIVGSTLKDSTGEKASAAQVSTSRSSHSHNADMNTDDASAPEPVTNFESTLGASEYAKMYRHDGLYGGHVVMLGRDDANRQAALEALRAYPQGLQVHQFISSILSYLYIYRSFLTVGLHSIL